MRRRGVNPTGRRRALAGPPDHEREAAALDVLIEQERELIAYFEARETRAEATAAAAVTAVLALAALTATAAKTIGHVNRTYAWVVVGALALVCVAALVVRSVAGLRARGRGQRHEALLSRGSREFDDALQRLRECGQANLDPVLVRQRALELCRERAKNAHRAAKSKDRWAAIASVALAACIALAASFALNLPTS
jgi:hypothetical protein